MFIGDLSFVSAPSLEVSLPSCCTTIVTTSFDETTGNELLIGARLVCMNSLKLY